MSANVGLAIQCVGILLVALLSLSMRSSIAAKTELKRVRGASPNNIFDKKGSSAVLNMVNVTDCVRSRNEGSIPGVQHFSR